MRNLLVLIANYHAFLLFIVLEIFCFGLITKYNHFQRAVSINSANRLSGSMMTKTKEVVGFFNLGEINDSLSTSNARLQNQISNLQSILQNNSQIDYCPEDEDSTSIMTYHYTAAKVINNSTNRANNYLTIDKGSRQGILKERGVISSNGVVGVVKDVSPNFATVISLLHKDMRISSKLQGNNHKGSLKWQGIDSRYAILEGIPKHTMVSINDTVLTSGFSTFFPPNIAVGVVKDVNTLPQNYFHEIRVELSTDFNKLEYIYVVDYIYKSEQKALEERSQND